MIFNRKQKVSSYVEEGHRTILEEALSRFRAAAEADEAQRELELDDLRFCDPDKQWPDDVRSQREAEDRPCLTVDRLGPFVHQIVNETRQNRPQPQVNPVGDGADKETAEILQGVIRHIAYQTNGDTAIDTAFESMVRCGRGYIRVLTDYANDMSFEQEIRIGRIPNPHLVYLDPSFQEPDGSDAEFGFISAYIPKEVYKVTYPGSKLANMPDALWQSIGDSTPEWAQKDGAGVLVVEYFRKVRKKKKVYLLEDGKTVTELPEGVEPKDTREALVPQIEWFKLNPVEILDKTVWPGRYIPIIPVLGTELVSDGQRSWAGLIRSAKDAQRAFNYWKSAQAETIALAPKAPWVGGKGFMGSMKSLWQSINRRPVAAIEYEAYDDQGRPIPPPQRLIQEPPIMAISQAMAGAVDDLKATTGMYDPSLGNRESSQSGVAIRQLQRQGQTGNYHFTDNLARSIRHLGRVLIDLIPKIYDTERVIRIVKPDETTDLVTINGPTEDPKSGLTRIYDLSIGTYDVTVSVGPGYQTKRQENLALLESMMQGPMGQLLAQAAPDLVVSMMDFQIAPELQERLKMLLPPQFQEKAKGQAPIPPQIQAQIVSMQQQGQALAQQHEQLVQALNEAQQKLEAQEAKAQAELQKAQLDAQTRLEIARMNNETELMKTEAQINAKMADEAVRQKLAELEAAHSELQDLTLAMHGVLQAQHEAQETPEQEAAEPPHDEVTEPKMDPIHKLMEGHTAALQGIGAALAKIGTPKKTRIISDEQGNPVGTEQVED